MQRILHEDAASPFLSDSDATKVREEVDAILKAYSVLANGADAMKDLLFFCHAQVPLPVALRAASSAAEPQEGVHIPRRGFRGGVQNHSAILCTWLGQPEGVRTLRT